MVRPDFQPMSVPEEPVCVDLFRQNPVLTFLHLKYPVHIVPLQGASLIGDTGNSATSYTGTSEMHYIGRLIDRRYRKLRHELHRYLRDALHRALH